MSGLIEEVQRNPRLRAGLWVIVGIFWLYAILTLRDEVRARYDQYAHTLQALARARGQAGQSEWLQRVEPVRQVVAKFEDRLWQADSPGLAQAAFQDWLTQALTQAGVPRPVVNVSSTESKSQQQDAAPGASTDAGETIPDDLWQVRAKVDMEFSPPSFLDFMARAADSPHQVVVESLIIHKDPVPHAEMVVLAYFRKSPAPKP